MGPFTLQLFDSRAHVERIVACDVAVGEATVDLMSTAVGDELEVAHGLRDCEDLDLSKRLGRLVLVTQILTDLGFWFLDLLRVGRPISINNMKARGHKQTQTLHEVNIGVL